MAPGIVCGILAGAMWGLVFIIPEVLSASSPLELAVGRYVAYGAICSLLIVPKARSLIALLRLPDYLALLRQASLGSFFYYVLLALGVQYAGVASTSIIIGMIPLVVTLSGRKEKDAPPLRHMALPLVCTIASVMALNIEAIIGGNADDSMQLRGMGLVFATGALLCWSRYAIDNARYLKQNPQFTSEEWSRLYGVASGILAFAIGIAACCFFKQGAMPLAHDGLRFWACNLAFALVTSVVANQLWNVASRRVPVSLSAQLVSSETLFAIVYGAAFHGRAFRLSEWLALCLLTFSIGASVCVHWKYASASMR